VTVTILDVPYFTQPTPITCQSTCLKMMALYYDRRLGQVPLQRDILEIWKAINTSDDRPSTIRNSYQNMVWWLNREFPSLSFGVSRTGDAHTARKHILDALDARAPVMVSTNHARTAGHIILVIGYLGMTTTEGAEFVCHDPYGRFDPQVDSKLYGRRRFEGGTCVGGGETGPGMAVLYDIDGIRRIRADKHSTGVFFMISAGVSV
jgi:hypothetical protein